MADVDALHIGENSPEQVAFKRILDTYAVSLLFARHKIATVGAVGRGG